MAKPNFYDEAYSGITDIIAETSQSIAEEFKGVKPFQKEEVPVEELYMYFSMIDEQGRALLKQKHGEEYDLLVAELDKFRNRRGI
uniref:Uncharacterized protein n=1 Tax=viral metagenome TaxID=1070528 RepID=A0A6M3KV00_9ZZZZ